MGLVYYIYIRVALFRILVAVSSFGPPSHTHTHTHTLARPVKYLKVESLVVVPKPSLGFRSAGAIDHMVLVKYGVVPN